MKSTDVYFLLKKNDPVAITQPKSCNVLNALLLMKSSLNCSSSSQFLCYYQSSSSRRDIINKIAFSQNKYQYEGPAIIKIQNNL